MNGEILSAETIEKIARLEKENEKLRKNQRFYKKFGDDYIFCLEGDKQTYIDLICVLQERIEKAIKLLEKGIFILPEDVNRVIKTLNGDEK